MLPHHASSETLFNFLLLEVRKSWRGMRLILFLRHPMIVPSQITFLLLCIQAKRLDLLFTLQYLFQELVFSRWVVVRSVLGTMDGLAVSDYG